MFFNIIMVKYDITYNNYSKLNKIYSYNYISSSNIEKAGFGIFAGKDYKKDDTVEIVPYVEVDSNNSIHPYTFNSHLDDSKFLIMLGKPSLINHSIEKENVKYKLDDTDRIMIFYAIKDISKDDEFYLNYGDDVNFNA